MEEQDLVAGYQVEGYFKRRNTQLKKGRKPFLHKFWRDFLLEHSLGPCQNLYIKLNMPFLQSGETVIDLRQEAFEDVLLTIYRFNPDKIDYKPIKRKRKSPPVFADLNDPVYHTKRFFNFTQKALCKSAVLSKLKKEFPKYDLYIAGLKEWLIRQFMVSFTWYVTNSAKENRLKLNEMRNRIHSQETHISPDAFNKAMVPIEKDEDDHKLEFLTENSSERLVEFMLDQYENKCSINYLKKKYSNEFISLLAQSNKLKKELEEKVF